MHLLYAWLFPAPGTIMFALMNLPNARQKNWSLWSINEST